MKKIFWGLTLLALTVFVTITEAYSQNNKEVSFYCISNSNASLALKYTKTIQEIKNSIIDGDWCSAFFGKNYKDIPEIVALEIDEIKNLKITPIPKWDLITNLLNKYNSEISVFREMELEEKLKFIEENKKFLIAEKNKKKQAKILELEKLYGKNCNKNNNYNECLVEQENKEKAILEAKKVKEYQKKLLIAEKQKIEREKTETKIANMKQEERRAYICENTYGFRKGSDKFSECLYKIMNAEFELQKLELQKKLAEAQQETARANESAARANASRNSAPAYDPNVAAAMERTNEIERARILLNLGQALRTPVTPQSSAPVPQTNCRVARGGYINCW